MSDDKLQLSGTGKEFGARGQKLLGVATHTEEYYALVVNSAVIISSLFERDIFNDSPAVEVAITRGYVGNTIGVGQQIFAPKGKKITSVTIDSGSVMGYLHKDIV